jgi:hypothetical protein
VLWPLLLSNKCVAGAIYMRIVTEEELFICVQFFRIERVNPCGMMKPFETL